MLRGGLILFTALFSKIFLKKTLYAHHYIGCILAIVGITVVGVSNFAFGNTGSASVIYNLIILKFK